MNAAELHRLREIAQEAPGGEHPNCGYGCQFGPEAVLELLDELDRLLRNVHSITKPSVRVASNQHGNAALHTNPRPSDSFVAGALWMKDEILKNWEIAE